MTDYPRDMKGYGRAIPDPKWPNGANVAVQFVLNYEEGGENSILHGDAASEAFLSDIAGAQPWPGQRHWNMESIYDYGARAGFWRLHRLLKDVPLTVYGVATALERAPEQVAAMLDCLRQSCDFVVVDLPRALVGWIEPVIERAEPLPSSPSSPVSVGRSSASNATKPILRRPRQRRGPRPRRSMRRAIRGPQGPPSAAGCLYIWLISPWRTGVLPVLLTHLHPFYSQFWLLL